MLSAAHSYRTVCKYHLHMCEHTIIGNITIHNACLPHSSGLFSNASRQNSRHVIPKQKLTISVATSRICLPSLPCWRFEALPASSLFPCPWKSNPPPPWDSHLLGLVRPHVRQPIARQWDLASIPQESGWSSGFIRPQLTRRRNRMQKRWLGGDVKISIEEECYKKYFHIIVRNCSFYQGWKVRCSFVQYPASLPRVLGNLKAEFLMPLFQEDFTTLTHRTWAFFIHENGLDLSKVVLVSRVNVSTWSLHLAKGHPTIGERWRSQTFLKSCRFLQPNFGIFSSEALSLDKKNSTYHIYI